MDFRPAVLGLVFASSSISWRHNHFFNYDIKKLIMMQKLQPWTADLNPTKIEHVNRVYINPGLVERLMI